MVELKLSTRAKYGLQAMVCLAQRDASTPMSVRDIAAQELLPEHYLEQIITPLRKAGLVESIRGAQGGYRLARAAETVTVLEVIEALDGPLDPAGCCEQVAEPGDDEGWLTALVWRPLRDAMRAFFGARSLQDLVEQAAQMEGTRKPIYYI